MNILIYRTSSIGDVILTTSLLSAITQKLPDSKIIFVTRQPQIDLMKKSYPTVRFVEAQKNFKLLSFLIQLSGLTKFDLILDLQVNLRSIFLTTLIKWFHNSTIVRMNKNSGFRKQLIRQAKRNENRIKKSATIQVQQGKFQYKMMLDALDIGLKNKGVDTGDLSGFSPRLNVSDIEFEFSHKLPKNYLAICVGAAHDTKKIPLELLSSTLNNWSKKTAGQNLFPYIVLLGSKDDFEAGQQLMAQMNLTSGFQNLAGKINFVQVAEVLSRANLLVSNDSALAHVAEAVGTPVAVFFGPTVEEFGFAPWRESSRAFSSSSVGCRPCSKHGKKVCVYGDKKCFSEINFENFLEFCLSKFQD